MSELLYAARLSQLVYDSDDPQVLENSIHLHELAISRVQGVIAEATGTEAFLFTSDQQRAIHIVVRGSQAPWSASGLRDWLNNFMSFKRGFYGIRVHAGYARAAESILPGLLALIATLPYDYRITLQGHSLGGSVSVLLAVALARKYPAARFNGELTLYTFGQRKVASRRDLRRAVRCMYVRVQSGSDVACRTPCLPGYGHAGLLLYLPNDAALGMHLINPSRRVRFADRFMTFGQRVTDHSMSGYLARLTLAYTAPESQAALA